jgi:hypothetical protein
MVEISAGLSLNFSEEKINEKLALDWAIFCNSGDLFVDDLEFCIWPNVYWATF